MGTMKAGFSDIAMGRLPIPALPASLQAAPMLATPIPLHDGPGHHALRRGRHSIPDQVYHVTVTTRQRIRYFVDFEAACRAAQCFEHPDLLRSSKMLAWILMPDHAHWLLQLGEGDMLADMVTRLKSASAREVNRVLGRRGPLWTRAYHDHALRSDEDLAAVALHRRQSGACRYRHAGW